MAWTQVYDPVVSEVVSACIAAIPLVILLYMLAIKRAKGHIAALAGLASAFIIAVLIWRMPVVTAISSVGLGVANGLFPIIWIVITAVWVYNMTVESGEFEIIKDSLARVTPDRRLQTIFIAFAFGSFLEGTAGIDNGQTFVLRGQGDHGVNGGPQGDVDVTVSVRPDPLFERDGYDVRCDIPLTFAQAALGDEITVPTIDGKVKYKVPEGTQNGTVFRLRNKGIQYVNGRGRGDQYVRVYVEVPRNLTAKQRDALREFEEATNDRNYEKRRSFFDKIKDAWEGKS